MRKTISVKEIMEELKTGIPDEELIKKYGLTEQGLKMAFERLLRAMATGASHIEIE